MKVLRFSMEITRGNTVRNEVRKITARFGKKGREWWLSWYGQVGRREEEECRTKNDGVEATRKEKTS